jgi:L-rhamnose mutarotase
MGPLKDFLSRRRPREDTPPASAVPPQENRFQVVVHLGGLIRLRREYEERYIILHRHVFPEVAERIRKSNIRNYSIFLSGGILFSHLEYVGSDHAADMAAMADPVTKEWWKLTDPMQMPLRTRKKGEWWSPALFLGHFGGAVDLPAHGMRWAFRRQIGRVSPGRLRSFVEQVRTGMVPALRARGLQNVSLYSRDGWLYVYGEYSGSRWEADGAAFLEDPATVAIEKGFLALLGAKKGRADRKAWEPMREVFHQK